MRGTTANQGHLLIVSTDADILRILQDELRNEYKIHLAHTMDEAYQIIHEQSIHVIISGQPVVDNSLVDFDVLIATKFPDIIRIRLLQQSDNSVMPSSINPIEIFRYVTQPWNPDELKIILKEAFEKYELIIKNRHLMLQLEQALEVKKHYDNLKYQLLTSMAHQFRTPLAVIQAANSLVRRNWKQLSYEQRVQKFDTIYNQVCQLSNLLDTISQAVEDHNKQAPFRPIEIDIAEFILQFSTNYSSQMDPNHQYHVRITNSIKKVVVDDNLLHLILMNLVTNAKNFSANDSNIYIDLLEIEDYIIIKVTDEGIGISAQDLPHIFDAYYRAKDVAETGHIKGLGLGLKIAKDYVALHGGHIEVKSALNVGTTVQVFLPKIAVTPTANSTEEIVVNVQ